MNEVNTETNNSKTWEHFYLFKEKKNTFSTRSIFIHFASFILILILAMVHTYGVFPGSITWKILFFNFISQLHEDNMILFFLLQILMLLRCVLKVCEKLICDIVWLHVWLECVPSVSTCVIEWIDFFCRPRCTRHIWNV